MPFRLLLLIGLVSCVLVPLRAVEAPHAPIPVKFSLKEPGYVTLVIEDAQGNRVRNLVGETYFTAGEHVVWWDGLDESGIVRGTPNFVYSVSGKLVAPGTYRVRGLTRKQLDLRYEMTVNCPGNLPWENEARTGGWLADHSPQTSCLFLPNGSPYGTQPQMLLASSVAEAGHSLIWTDLEGKKLYGSKAFGWEGAHAMARDAGPNADPDCYAYLACYANAIHLMGLQRDGKTAMLRIYDPRALQASEELPPAPITYKRDDTNHIDIAAYNGVCVISLPPENKLAFVNTRRKDAKNATQCLLLGFAEVPAPAGLLVTRDGKLLVTTGKEVHAFDVDWATGKLSNERALIPAAAGLQDPHKMTMDAQGNLYISDWGNSNQVKVFAPDGRLLRAIGKAGPLQVGPYDPNGMTQPNGIAISADNHLWVAECSYLPKRCSVWSLDGKLVKDFIGPTPYGGGGILDPKDKTRFFFSPHSGCLEFKLDWATGTSSLKNVLFRPNTGRLEILDKDKVWQVPHLPVYAGDRQYLTNVYNENDGPGTVGIWQVRAGQAILVAAVGTIRTWSVVDDLVMQDNWLKDHLPEGISQFLIAYQGKQVPLFNRAVPGQKPERVNLTFAWSDLNNNEKVEREELSFTWTPHPTGGYTVADGLVITDQQGDQFAPTGFTEQGVPIFNAAQVKRLLKEKVEVGVATRQAVVGKDGWLVITGGPIEGFRDGELKWRYHSQWPTGMALGLSPKTRQPGQLFNTMELLGPTVTPKGSDAGEIWAIDGDYGNIFLLTTDGLFVGTLFQDTRHVDSPYWPDPAKRGMLLNDCTLLAECYFPTMTQLTDGSIYLQAGKNRSSIVRLEGLESIRRLPATDLVVTEDMLKEAKAYFLALAEQQAQSAKDEPLTVLLRDEAPEIDGDLSDWAGAYWVDIDEKTRAAVMVADDTLYAAYSTEYDFPLANNPDSLPMLFKSGDALDLMLGTNAKADPARKKPAAGDLRLTVSLVNKKPVALLSRPVAPGAGEPVKYESPIGMTVVDQVLDVSAQVQLAGKVRESRGNNSYKRLCEYEIAVPLATLGLTPDEKQLLTGDIGILRGKAGLTAARIYWHNKATGQTADLPTEALLTPSLWGKICFTRDPAPKTTK